MILLDFIREHEDWRELLSNEPYFISIKEENGYALFKYNQIDSDMSLDIVKVCRGIIIDLERMCVAGRGFDKFFNATEPNAATLSGSIRAEEKIDGSIIKVWKNRDGEWMISTNGTINAKNADLAMATNDYKSYYDLFAVALEKSNLDLSSLDGDNTYIFELVSPLNRIVIPYKETELYFLGMRNNITGKETSPIDMGDFVKSNGLKTPMIYDIKSIDEALEVAKTLGNDKEGFVLVDKEFNRVKVKGSEYLALHILRNNDLSMKNFLVHILDNTQDDLIAYFPEYEPYIEELEDKLNAYKKAVKEAIASAPWDVDRKSFAMAVKESPYSAILFKLYGNKDYDWEKEIINIDNINRLAQILEI